MSNKRGKQLNKYVPDYVLFDLETTGISANYDEVIEISAVKVRGGKIVDGSCKLLWCLYSGCAPRIDRL